MFVSCLLSVSLAVAASAAPGSPPDALAALPTQTLWLVQPLYPGQDTLVKRTESGIDALLPADVKAQQIIGRDALVAYLPSHQGDLACVTGSGARCKEPLEAYLASLGLERVVLVQVGQDDTGFRFRAVSVRPDTGSRTQAEATNPAFEKALAGALVKFVSLNATLEAVTEPAGATLFIDGTKMGVTPLTTEVLPGEHTFRFELASHLPQEVTQVVASRAKVQLRPTLEKVPARLVVKVLPVGSEIRVDGKLVGTDAVDQGIQPGAHTFNLTLEGYEPIEVKSEIAPGETYTLEKELKPTGMQAFKLAMRRRQEATMARQSYLEASFEQVSLTAEDVKTQPVDKPSEVKDFRTQNVRSPSSRKLRGLGIEYGRYGQYFGVMLVGATYYTTGDTWNLGVTVPDGATSPQADVIRGNGNAVDTKVQLLSFRALQPQMRYVIGPLSFAIQAGVEVKGVLAKERDSANAVFSDGLYAVDVHIAGQATMRVAIYEGLYASVAYQRSIPLMKNLAGLSNLRGGIGYAF